MPDLADIIRRVAIRYEGALSPGLHLQRDLGIDSLGLVQLIAQIEREYAIELRIEDLQLEHFATVDSVRVLLARYGC